MAVKVKSTLVTDNVLDCSFVRIAVENTCEISQISGDVCMLPQAALFHMKCPAFDLNYEHAIPNNYA